MRVKFLENSVSVLVAALGSMVVSSPQTVSAEPIVAASIPIVAEGGSYGTWDSAYFIYSMSPTLTVRLFETTALTPSSAGTTLVANAANDDDFTEIARQMTNGRGNWNEWLFGPTPGSGGGVGAATEQAMFNLATLDFRGWTLTGIAFDIDQLTISHPTGAWTEMSVRGRLSVLGTGSFDPAPVPEPGTMMLLATGALGLFRVRRRAKSVHHDQLV